MYHMNEHTIPSQGCVCLCVPRSLGKLTDMQGYSGHINGLPAAHPGGTAQRVRLGPSTVESDGRHGLAHLPSAGVDVAEPGTRRGAHPS